MSDPIAKKYSRKNKDVEHLKIDNSITPEKDIQYDCEEDEDEDEEDEEFLLNENDLMVDDEEEVGISDILENLFTDPRKNRNICEVLLEIKKSIDMNTCILKNVLVNLVQKQK